MKRIGLCFLILSLCFLNMFKAWALPDNVRPNEYSGSQMVKASGGFVYSVNVSGKGVTAGDTVQLVDGGSGGTVRYTCVMSGANASCVLPYTAAAIFDTNIYLKETKGGGGTFTTDIQLF